MAQQKFETLEQAFVDVRQERLQHLASGTLTSAVEEKLSRAELRALYALLDYRAAQSTQESDGSRRLPAKRNIGGIIGPY